MNINHINKEIIEQIRNGSEKAFSELYSAYYSYLNAVALCYLLDKNCSAEIVDDVFVNIWNKRDTLSYPIHYYLGANVDINLANEIRPKYRHNSTIEEINV